MSLPADPNEISPLSEDIESVSSRDSGSYEQLPVDGIFEGEGVLVGAIEPEIQATVGQIYLTDYRRVLGKFSGFADRFMDGAIAPSAGMSRSEWFQACSELEQVFSRVRKVLEDFTRYPEAPRLLRQMLLQEVAQCKLEVRKWSGVNERLDNCVFAVREVYDYLVHTEERRRKVEEKAFPPIGDSRLNQVGGVLDPSLFFSPRSELTQEIQDALKTLTYSQEREAVFQARKILAASGCARSLSFVRAVEYSFLSGLHPEEVFDLIADLRTFDRRTLALCVFILEHPLCSQRMRARLASLVPELAPEYVLEYALLTLRARTGVRVEIVESTLQMLAFCAGSEAIRNWPHRLELFDVVLEVLQEYDSDAPESLSDPQLIIESLASLAGGEEHEVLENILRVLVKSGSPVAMLTPILQYFERYGAADHLRFLKKLERNAKSAPIRRALGSCGMKLSKKYGEAFIPFSSVLSSSPMLTLPKNLLNLRSG